MEKHIIFVPGKNPKPSADEHKDMLWRTLLEGVRRVEPDIAIEIEKNKARFNIVAWNYTYYQQNRDPVHELPWIDALLNQYGPTLQDVREARSRRVNWNRFFYTVADYFPRLIRWLPESTKNTIEEMQDYFENQGNIGYEIRSMVKMTLRTMLDKNESVLIIGHSFGSVIVYDALWELSHHEVLPGKVDFLSLGSPLGLKFVQHKLQGREHRDKNKFPHNIHRWINLSSVGDIKAVDSHLNDDFSDMLKYGLIESIEEHHEGIYNFYRNEKGLDTHNSYGYLVNPAVGNIIAQWWKD